ncbi:MAG: PD40 domain-containing protein, partial [Bacteroidales bacterium]|nr:PD40 domain-containing protein [Bacteroidales bacterium]
YSYPVVQWNPNLDVLAYFYEKKGKLWFAIYNCKNQDGIVQEFHHFEKVLDFSYSQDGNRIVFTGVRGGQTDVYEYHIPTFEYTQLTNDAWDERSPIYLQGDKKIVFASNKNGGAQNKNYDLFVYDGKTVERLHPTVADEGKSVELADGSFLYLMSDNTASKLYSVKMDSTVSYVDTAFHYSYFNNDYVLKNPIENVSTFSLADNQLLQVFQSENCNKLHLSKIDEHSFEPIDFEQNEQILTDCENFVQPERETANLYNRNFYINQLVNQLDFNFVNTGYQAFTGGEYNYGQRVNMLLKLGVIDLFEDYRLTGAYRFSGILGANEYLLSLENLKHRIDRQYVFHRQTSLVYRTNSSTVYYDRVQDNNFICRYKYPISQLHSISVNPSFRYVRNVALAMNDKTLVEPTVDEFWLGLSCNYVFDNVRKIDVNIYNGTRTKVFAECFGQLNKKDSYLAVFGFDARHYQKLHRNLILASRIAFSSSYGTSPLLFYLGAVDNWINLFGRYTVYDSSIEYDHSVNWAYQAVGTNMRGFAQNIRNGNTFAVANVELRWPMIQYFFAKPLKSDILRYFQVVGFADFGGAWSGLIPGLKDNAYNFTIIDTAPIHVEIDEQRQPFVAGYGYGFRTRLFGYMIRLDIGWGYDEGVVQKLSQFSLGMDF